MELCLYDWIDLLSWAPKTHSCVEKPQKNFVEMFHFLRETGQRHLQPTGSLCLRAGRIANSNRKLSCSLRKQWLKNNFLHISRRCWASWIPCRKESSISCFGINSVNSYMVVLKMLLCAVLSHLSHVRLFETLWTIAHEAPLSMRFSRKEYWSGLPCPPPRDLPNPGIKPASLMSPALAGGFFTTSTTQEAQDAAHSSPNTDRTIDQGPKCCSLKSTGYLVQGCASHELLHSKMVLLGY